MSRRASSAASTEPGGDQRHAVAQVADRVHGEDRLVLHDDAERPAPRDILRRQHGLDAGQLRGLRRIDADNAGVRMLRAQDFPVQLVRERVVGREFRRARHFSPRVDAAFGISYYCRHCGAHAILSQRRAADSLARVMTASSSSVVSLLFQRTHFPPTITDSTFEPPKPKNRCEAAPPGVTGVGDSYARHGDIGRGARRHAAERTSEKRSRKRPTLPRQTPRSSPMSPGRPPARGSIPARASSNMSAGNPSVPSALRSGKSPTGACPTPLFMFERGLWTTHAPLPAMRTKLRLPDVDAVGEHRSVADDPRIARAAG